MPALRGARAGGKLVGAASEEGADRLSCDGGHHLSHFPLGAVSLMGREIIHGNCLEAMAGLHAQAIVCDPPYGLNFMGKNWDAGVPGEAFWRVAIECVSPGSYLLAFGGTRKWHRLAVAIEDAGWEMRDTLMWLYGCLSDDTEILIDGKWEPYHKALIGRHTLTYNIESGCFAWQAIQECFVYEYDDTAYRISSNQTDQIVTKNHRCLVEQSGRYVFAVAEKVARQCQAHVPILENLRSLLKTLPCPHEGTGHTRSTLAEITPTHYRGVVWCIRVPTGAFVARRNGKVFITGNSGFPKSHNVSKAIDKAAGAKREQIPATGGLHKNKNLNDDGWSKIGQDAPTMASQNAITEAAQHWQGFGTALKPAWEPILMFRKPLDGTVAETVQAHGTGALNVDGCRIGNSKQVPGSDIITAPRHVYNGGYGPRVRSQSGMNPNIGRWPANLVLDEEAAAMLDQQSGERPSSDCTAQQVNNQRSGYGGGLAGTRPARGFSDTGGASRFFYCAKASTAERNAGLAGLTPGKRDLSRNADQPSMNGGEGNPYNRGCKLIENRHPTVKPVSLMRWLCRLVTPPGGTILDPFMGSGSTGVACALEGFDFIGIDLDAGHCEVASKRIEWAENRGEQFVEADKEARALVEAGLNQQDLFA